MYNIPCPICRSPSVATEATHLDLVVLTGYQCNIIDPHFTQMLLTKSSISPYFEQQPAQNASGAVTTTNLTNNKSASLPKQASRKLQALCFLMKNHFCNVFARRASLEPRGLEGIV